MSDISSLVDYEARRAIREDLSHTLIVEAAAGTGKTTELVQRMVAMLASGQARMSSLVAVTFTEKAAGEMKLRLRTELDRAHAACLDDAAQRERLSRASAELEAAHIGTIHALCADLLRAHPIEARVDPAFEVIDGSSARRLLERVFDTFLEASLAEPSEGVRRVLRKRVGEGKGRGPRSELLDAAARMVETRDFDAPYRRDPLDRRALLLRTHQRLGELVRLGERCRSSYDRLARALAMLGQRLSRVSPDDHDALEHVLLEIERTRDIWSGKGSGKTFAPGLLRDEVLEERERVRADLAAANQALQSDLAACLSRELLPVVERYQDAKLRLGVLDFFDLLVCTRNLLQQSREVRGELQQRITHLFVDEFQDTDPVQSEILLLLAADDPKESEPFRVQLVPGKLFLVGDPKQSIYRFRRADVALYARVKQHLCELGARVVHLTTSFRSLPEIQSLINASFAQAMAGDAERGQADYVPLSAFRPSRADQPAIVALPVPAPYGKSGRVTKTAIKTSLPDAVAAWIEWLVTKSGYVVREDGRDVPVAARHVCLLFRRFRDWDGEVTRDYVRALEARRIPHVLSGGRSFHTREEVAALSVALSAIEWPDDALSVYATLRGPFVALSDDVLFMAKQRFSHLHPLRALSTDDLPVELSEVADALSLLGRLHKRRNRRPVAATLSELLHATRAHAGLAIWPTGEQALGNVLRLLDMARAYERRSGATSFRGFVELLEEHAAGGEAPDAPVIEESSDGVRIMTVHAAKGLEFPVVVLCDPNAPKRPERGSRYIDPERRIWAQALCGAEPAELVEHRERVRDHDEAEIVRLAYVAATRGREMLVVPVVGDEPMSGWLDVLNPAVYPPKERFRAPSGRGIACPSFGADSVRTRGIGAERDERDSVMPGEHRPAQGAHSVTFWDPHVLDLERPATGGLSQQDLLQRAAEPLDDAGGLEEYERFVAARAEALSRAAQASVSVRAITEAAHAEQGREAERPFVLDSGIERVGRPSGARFGTLVHALLAEPDAIEPAVAERLVAMLARELGATQDEQRAALCAAARAQRHPLLERARQAEARGACFREHPVCLKLEDGSVLEGVIDLAFVEPHAAGERVVLVDFKTDQELSDLAAYARQLALYGKALEGALGLTVEPVLLRV